MDLNIDQLIADATAHGGGTYKVTEFDGGLPYVARVNFDTGYYVSAPNGIENLPLLSEDLITHFALSLDTDTEYLGLWRDDNGLWSLDRSYWFTSKFIAFDMAVLNHQRAIWDVAHNEAIDVMP